MADDQSAKPPDDASTETDNRSTTNGEETDCAGLQSVHFTGSGSTSGGAEEDVDEGRLPLDLPTSGYSQTIAPKERSSLAVESYQLQQAMKQAEEVTSEEEEVRTQRERMAAKARLHLLENEILDYKRKVAHLQDGQQRQLTLIQNLQGQVNDYKRKNTDLEIDIEELKMENKTKTKKLQSKTMENDSRLEARENMAKMREDSLIAELENIAATLEQERAKSAELARINEALQDQLEEAALANQGLSRDVAQLTQAWRQATQQLERREVEWHTEEVAFNDYFASEHNRLLALWREVVALRRQFTELRHQTSRDFAQINSEIMRFSHGMHAACTTLATNLKASQLESADALAKSRRQLMKEEEDAKLRAQSLTESLARSQSKLAEAESKLIELAQKNQELADELTERDRVLKTLQRLRSSFPRIAVEAIEEQTSPIKTSALRTADDPISATRKLIEQTYTMHQALSQIAQMVIADSAGADADEAQEPLITSFQVRYKAAEKNLAELTAVANEFASASPPPLRTPRPRSTSPPSNGSRETIAPRVTRSRSPVSSQQTTRCLEFNCLQSSRSVPKLAETTVAGVQTALNRRSIQVQALRLKLTHLRGRITALNKRLEDGDAERRRLGEQVANLRNDCDLARKEAEVARLERDKSKNALSLSLEEKNILERSRVTSLEQLASMQNEMEQLRQMLQATARERDEVAEQRDEKRLAYESEVRETARLQRLLDQAESRSSQLREKITELQDLQRRTQMEKDVLGHEKSEVLDRAEKAEQKLVDLDKKMANMRKEEDHMHDTLARLENIAEARECERSELAHQLHLVQANETRLAEERNNLRTECQRLRNQLTRTEMEHSAANAETERLRDALTQAERLHKQVEAEVAVVSKERFELTEALAASSRQTSSLTEELDNLRRETGLQSNTINRLTSEREELLQEKTDLTSRISVAERERRQLTDLVAKLRTDKEVLENEAFIAQRVITDLKNKEEKLETDVANLTLRRKNLQAEVHRIRTDFEVELAKIQRQRDRLDNKYTSEVDELRLALANADRRLAEAEEAAVQAVLRADRAAAEAAKATLREADRHGLTELECQRWAEEQGQLNAEILVAQRERDEALRRAEQEHQRVLAIAAEDQAAVRERAMLLQETIVDLEKTLERTKREAASRAEKDEIALKTTTEDLRKCREQLEETCASHEREVLGFRTQIKTLQENYEMASKELSNAQLQLRLQAESRLTNRSEVSETAKLLRESEQSCNTLRREFLEYRKRQSELEAEKCSVEAANSDLRRQLRTLELERVEQGCSISELQSRLEACDKERRNNERLLLDLRQNIEDAGKSDVTARREVSELRLQLKETETINEQLKQTVSDLRASLAEELANVEEMKRESVNLRQRLSETESMRHSLQTELSLAQRRLAESEEKLRSRERTMNQALEDCKRDSKRVEESKQILQSRLETAEQQVSALRANLATQEGRLRSLQNDLNWTAALRKDAEARLAAIHGLLRRLLGFRQSLRSTGWVTTTPELPITPALRSKVRTVSDQQETRPGGEADKEAASGDSAAAAAAGNPRNGNKTLISERRTGDETEASPSSSRRARSTSPDKRYIDIESRSLSGERHLSRLQTSAWSDIFCEAKEGALDFGKSPGSESSPTGHAVSVPDCTNSFSGISAMPYGLRKRLARLAASSSYLQSVPGSDLDPDAVCSALRELLRHLLRLERDRDDALLAVRVRDEKAQDQKAQLAERDDLIGHLQANQRKLEEGT
uniref:Rootletin-like coiled-coil domain-containing protein n=1 Tax=Schistocephalus solidus TaxID=70667 RepID=A0A0X3PDD7_SCHSO